MHSTLVLFAATYEDGVYIDCKCSEDWQTAYNYWLLIEQLDTDEAKKALFDSIPEPEHSIIQRHVSAYQGMEMRKRFNTPRLHGPHVFHTEDPLTDEFLIDWAKHNIFDKRKKEKRHA